MRLNAVCDSRGSRTAGRCVRLRPLRAAEWCHGWPAPNQRDIRLDDTALRRDRAVLAGNVRSQSERKDPGRAFVEAMDRVSTLTKLVAQDLQCKPGFMPGRSERCTGGSDGLSTTTSRSSRSAASQARHLHVSRRMPAVPCDAIVLRTVRPPRPQYCRCRRVSPGHPGQCAETDQPLHEAWESATGDRPIEMKPVRCASTSQCFRRPRP